MTKSGKVRINQLSRDLGLPAWQVVFDAAEKLSIPAKSHSSSINGEQAETIIGHLVAEGHLSEDLASAYKTRAVQKEKTVGSDKPGQAQPAPKQAKPTSKASTVRLKAKPVVTARPTPAQASSPRKPAPRPSPANQRLHRKPSQPVNGGMIGNPQAFLDAFSSPGVLQATPGPAHVGGAAKPLVQAKSPGRQPHQPQHLGAVLQVCTANTTPHNQLVGGAHCCCCQSA